MSNLDRELPYLSGRTGVPIRAQLRLRYFDDVMKMTNRGYSEDDIDRSLFAKLIKENPAEAVSILNGSMSLEEAEQRLLNAGINPNDLDNDEIENLRQLGGLLKDDRKSQQTPKNNNTTKKYFDEQKIFLLKSGFSAWIIWVIVIFFLNAIEVINPYSDEEYFSWLAFPPIVCIAVFIWIRKFILKK